MPILRLGYYKSSKYSSIEARDIRVIYYIWLGTVIDEKIDRRSFSILPGGAVAGLLQNMHQTVTLCYVESYRVFNRNHEASLCLMIFY
jgi:hypothetical protein